MFINSKSFSGLLRGFLAGLLPVAGAGCSSGQDASVNESASSAQEAVVAPPPSVLAGNSNYWITAANPNARTGLPITGLNVAVAVTQDLQIPNGLSIQLNGWSAPTSNVVWQQYGFSVTPPSLGWGIENWPTPAYRTQLGLPAGGSLNFPASLEPNLPVLPRAGALPAGYVLDIVFHNDANGNITGTTYQVTDSCGVTSSVGPVNIVGTSLVPSGAQGTIPASALAPIYALQLNLVNMPGSTIVFSSGAGTITYSASEPLYVSNHQPSWTAAQGVVTGENSTIAYSELSSTPSSTIVQQFGNSNAGLVSAAACDWSTSVHPFDSVVAGSDGDGTPLMPCHGSYGGNSVQVGKTRADWNFCDISFGGSEQHVSPYETLVAAWANETNGAVPSNALQFGTDGAGGPPLYPCRALLNGDGYQLGKVRPGFAGCDIPYGGAELTSASYQVLTTSLPLLPVGVTSAPPPTSAAAGGNAAIIGGYDTDGAPLYVCQALFDGGLVPGKTRSNWTACHVSWGGQEQVVSSYNVLVPKFETPEFLPQPFNGGEDTNGSPLGICRTSYQNSEQVGKYLSNGNCNFGFGGTEISVSPGESQALLF
jgi:hypothetical protein